MSNCIETVISIVSTDTHQGVAFPRDVIFNSFYYIILYVIDGFLWFPCRFALFAPANFL